MDKISDSAGTMRPNRQTNLSEVITALKQENHVATVISMNAAATPYRRDARVRGFPPGR
jgi:hypothetical protein